MNQTAWIVGGGAFVVIVAGILYVMSGDGLPKTEQKQVVDVSAQSAPITITDASTSPVIAAMPGAPKLTPIKETTPMNTPTPDTKPKAVTSQPTSEVLHTSIDRKSVV